MALINIIIIAVIIIIINYLNEPEAFTNSSEPPDNPNPCDEYLSDSDFLAHMIPHHEVAVEISKLLQKKTMDPIMMRIVREIIWTQNVEIWMMKKLLNNLPGKVSSSQKMDKTYIKSLLDIWYPDDSSMKNVNCDPHFFDHEKHMEHLKHVELTNKYYLDHMVPHHQIAVDMSKRLLKHTKNDFMIYFCYRIIRSQSAEIFEMKLMSKNMNMWRYDSALV
jgi:uncharacterized protein (DUF305 family)